MVIQSSRVGIPVRDLQGAQLQRFQQQISSCWFRHVWEGLVVAQRL
jgi:hypothetical protein